MSAVIATAATTAWAAPAEVASADAPTEHAPPTAPADEYLLRAEAMLARGEFEAALYTLEIALRLDPDHIDALYIVAMLSADAGDHARAVRALEHIIRLDPDADDARMDLATALWHLGDNDAARTGINKLLARHPTFAAALELQSHLEQGLPPPARPSPWRPLVRLSVGGGYDSNVALDPGTIADPSTLQTAVLHTEVALGLYHDTPERPLAVFAHLASTGTPTRDRTIDELLPTVVGLTAIGQKEIGYLQLGLNARYDELFTARFATHRQRRISPAVYASYPIGDHQRLRLLLGGDWQHVLNLNSYADSTTATALLRDEIFLDKLLLVADVSARQNFPHDTTSQTLGFNRFKELVLALYGQYRLTDTLEGFGLLQAEGRRFAPQMREITYRAQGGVRVIFGMFELYADYTYSTNQGIKERAYVRHEANTGIRFWYD